MLFNIIFRHITQINFQPPYATQFNILIEGVLYKSFDWYDFNPSINRGDLVENYMHIIKII